MEEVSNPVVITVGSTSVMTGPAGFELFDQMARQEFSKQDPSQDVEKVNNQTEKLELELLTQPILSDDKIPMVELMIISLNRIFGSVELKNVGVLSEEDQYGVIAYYMDSRFGFTLTAKPDHFEFWLSVNGDRMMINQLELFDQMRTWGFKL